MKIGATILMAAGLLAAAAARGDAVSITGDRCSPTVRIVANDARLSDVLRRLARALDFDLAFEARNDPPVTADASRRAVDLLTTLAHGANISIAQDPDSRCASGKRIAKVWILPGPDAPTASRTRTLVSGAALASARITSDGKYWLITSDPSNDEGTDADVAPPPVLSTEEP